MLALLLCCAVPAAAVETPIPPPPTRWVTDTVGFLSPQARSTIEGQLEAYSRSSGNQVLVWIGDTTGDTPTEDWTVRAFERWKVGQKGLDNGLALFVFSVDRKVRVEVGYGLEDRVPDVVAARVIRETVVPRIQAGDRDGAVAAGLSALVAAVSGEPGTAVGAPPLAQSRDRTAPSRAPSVGQIVLFALLATGFIILLITNPSLALYLLFTILSGGRGGGSGGGGGFSGGGGRSGGGGATGSW